MTPIRPPTKTQVPDSNCFKCGYLLSGAARLEGDGLQPFPGCLVVCVECTAIMIFADDMTLRPLTEAEMSQVTNDRTMMDEIARTVTAINLGNAQRN